MIIVHTCCKARQIVEKWRESSVLIAFIITAALVSSLTTSGTIPIDMPQVTGKVPNNGHVMIYPAVASQGDSDDDVKGASTGGDELGSVGDQGDADTQKDGEMELTDSPEPASSPTSQGLVGKESLQIQDNIFNSNDGGNNIIARD